MKERELFETALEIDDPAARLAHLHAKCAGDTDLLARVAALLASHEGQSQFLNIPVVEQMADISEEKVAATMICGNGSTQDDEPDATAAHFPGPATMTENSDDADNEIPLGYLEPSTKPGSLGRLGHYEVLEVIGRGAFGTVLRAFDEKLQRVVAIKVMASELAATSPARKRFLREAQASAAIRHEHVVSVYAVEERPIPYLVMEYIPGQTLQQRIDERGPLDVPSVLRLGRQIAEGLAAAHGQDLIHRDIKPGNILLETGVHDRVKITDFGLARAADDASLTQSGTIAGTPMYMAPEQALGHKLDQRADLFSFGSVLYQLVSGRPPFRAPSVLAVLKRVAEEVPRPIQEIIPEAPQWLCDIIAKLHAKNPDDRYQSAQEVADVLANCEFQLKAHAGVKDLSLIPRVKREPAAWRKWVAAAAVVLPLLACGLFALSRPEAQPKITERKTGSATKAAWHGWPAGAPHPAIAPFDASQAKKHQAEWAAFLKVPVEYTNSIGMKFVLIPPGEFMMGSTREESDAASVVAGTDEIWKEHIRSEAPRHKVILTRPFYLGVHEVTQAQYGRVVGPHVSYFSATGIGSQSVIGIDTENHPVEMVNWNDAAEFCAQLNKIEQLQAADARTGDTISQIEANGYRLPTEAVWEFACRAGTTSNCWSGDEAESLLNSAWFKANAAERTHSVGELKANPFGLCDIHGNVWEWVQDRWDVDYYKQFREKTAIDPVGPAAEAGSRYGLRGGDWASLLSSCRSAHRHVDSATARFGSVGFRAALPVDAVRAAMQRTPVDVAKEKTPDKDDRATPPLAIAPFHATQARAHQEVWAKHLGAPVEYTNSIGMKFVLIPPGEFQMGSSEREIAQVLASPGVEDWMKAHLRSESRARRAAVREPYWIGIHEVTIGQFRAFVKATNYQTEAEKSGGGVDWSEEANDFTQQPQCVWNNPKYVWSELQPVAFMGREDADKFCAWLSENDGRRYGIPTGEQWEFACRAGSTTRFFFGDDETRLNEFGWVLPDSGYKVIAVGQLRANPFGLFDTLGNADELTVDRSTSLIERGGNGRSAWQLARSATGWARKGAQPFGGFRVVVGGELGPRTSVPTSNPVVKQVPRSPTFKNSIGMEFVIVPKGKSWLGGGGSKNTLGGKEVEIPADFYLGKYEVTQEEWEKVMGENPSHFSREGRSMDAVKDVTDADLMRFPVENVSWDDCQVFVAKLNKLEKETGWVYRLPKEVEWEYACRGGPMSERLDSGFDFYFAKPTQTLLPEQANFKHDKGLKRTCQVGSYQPNVLGLYDMHGNAWEWCEDAEKAADGASHRVIRSASWSHVSGQCRATDRYAANQSARTNDLGLRLARVPSSAPLPEAQTPPTVATFTAADVQRIAALPAAEQVEEVRKELMRRNPGFDGKLEYKIEDGVVTEFRIVADNVTDIAPIRVFNGLRVLDCHGTWTNKANGILADLTPLKGMNLANLTHLDFNHTQVSDAGLAHFKDCKTLTYLDLADTRISDTGLFHFNDCKNLTVLYLHWTTVSDAGLVQFQDCKDLTRLSLSGTKVSEMGLARFKNCKNLTHLDINHTQVDDAGLAHFNGMRLAGLCIDNTGITDLNPLQGMPLEEIRLTPKNITRGLDVLRNTKSLKTIGVDWSQSWPAAEFWERYDKGEFKE